MHHKVQVGINICNQRRFKCHRHHLMSLGVPNGLLELHELHCLPPEDVRVVLSGDGWESGKSLLI